MIFFNAESSDLKYAFELSLKFKEPIIFPTDTIFGIGATLNNIEANEKIYDIKKRDRDKPFPILVSDFDMLETIAYIDKLPPSSKKILLNNDSKKTTYILPAKKTLNKIYKINDTVAVRIPTGTYLITLLSSMKTAITATSVNCQSEYALNDIKIITEKFKDNLSVFINGITSTASSSSIIDLTNDTPKKVR